MEKVVRSLITNIVKWTPSGIGVSITAHSLWNHDWTQAILISFLTASSSLWVRFSGKFMEEAEKEAEKRGSGLPQWLFVVGDRAAIAIREKMSRSWRNLTSDFEDKYYQRLIYICRSYETQGLDKDRVLKLKQVFVPLKISQKSLARISQDLIQSLPDSLSKKQEIGGINLDLEMRLSASGAIMKKGVKTSIGKRGRKGRNRR